nr:hypothetical protein [Bradyrhizobium vignae]
MIRKAKAVLQGTGLAGSGHLSSESGVLAETPNSFKTRFANWAPTPIGTAMDQVRAILNSNRDEILQNTFTRGLSEEEH